MDGWREREGGDGWMDGYSYTLNTTENVIMTKHFFGSMISNIWVWLIFMY